MNLTAAFVIGMAGWAYILYEIFLGEASKVSANNAPPAVQTAFKTMRIIVTVGWAIYPLGYVFGYFTGSGPEESMASLNIIYNLADVINKIGFGLVIWAVAVKMSDEAAIPAKS
jgi:bacteriorhodopsin